jgi:hypothetical protein
MTESEWLSSRESHEMLAFLWDRADEARLRRFSVGCCRRIWPLLVDERSRRAVEAIELDLNEGIGDDECVAAARSAADALADAYRVLDIRRKNGHLCHAARAAALCAYEPEVPLGEAMKRRVVTVVFDCAVLVASESAAAKAVSGVHDIESKADAHARLYELVRAEYAEQAERIREIFGNPFSPSRPI